MAVVRAFASPALRVSLKAARRRSWCSRTRANQLPFSAASRALARASTRACSLSGGVTAATTLSKIDILNLALAGPRVDVRSPKIVGGRFHASRGSEHPYQLFKELRGEVGLFDGIGGFAAGDEPSTAPAGP